MAAPCTLLSGSKPNPRHAHVVCGGQVWGADAHARPTLDLRPSPAKRRPLGRFDTLANEITPEAAGIFPFSFSTFHGFLMKSKGRAAVEGQRNVHSADKSACSRSPWPPFFSVVVLSLYFNSTLYSHRLSSSPRPLQQFFVATNKTSHAPLYQPRFHCCSCRHRQRPVVPEQPVPVRRRRRLRPQVLQRRCLGYQEVRIRPVLHDHGSRYDPLHAPPW
ncbi:hypothetical protein GQ54DRAFT_325113 [Martensiomyces pterosporus]|nr:hypothetical protein GQ54DRAFT_325113 [Martensiomyces pterosporus]